LNHLLRELAPLSETAWAEIEREARRSLEHFLTARRLVEFCGPVGWEQDAVPRGRVVDVSDPAGGDVRTRRRNPLPLVELRSDFAISCAVLDAIDRGAADADLDVVRDAARQLAFSEDTIVLGAGEGQDSPGLAAASPHPVVPIGDDAREMPRAVARAVRTLRDVAVAGPYAVALGSNTYTEVVETTEMGGYPVLEHLRLIAGGPVVWAPTVDGAIVCSTRGGDARLTIGQDAALGYAAHDENAVHLYIEESLAFEVLTPEAAVRLANGAT
jgi:uncharacterized linocin/CFP29 family protein